MGSSSPQVRLAPFRAHILRDLFSPAHRWHVGPIGFVPLTKGFLHAPGEQERHRFVTCRVGERIQSRRARLGIRLERAQIRMNSPESSGSSGRQPRLRRVPLDSKSKTPEPRSARVRNSSACLYAVIGACSYPIGSGRFGSRLSPFEMVMTAREHQGNSDQQGNDACRRMLCPANQRNPEEKQRQPTKAVLFGGKVH